MTRLAMGFILQKPGLLVNPRYPNCPAPGAHSKAIGMVGSENPPYVLPSAMSTKSVIRRLDELLKPLGFVRHKVTWNRPSGSFVDVIDVQTSKSGDMITINAGVFDPEVYRQCWPEEPRGIIQEPNCTVRARVGELVEGLDLWWDLGEQETLDDVADKLTSDVLPFLERMNSREAMEEFLTNAEEGKKKYPPHIIYLAILKNERGDREGACALLTEFGKKAIGAWKTRVNEIAERLACS